MYDKYSCLRVETTINDPKEFKVYKDVRPKDGTTSKRWVPMGKPISNLYRHAEVSKASNRRFLEAIQDIVPSKSIEEEINGVCNNKTVNGKTYSGFNVWAPDTFSLFEEVSDGKYLIRGFTNKDVRKAIYGSLSESQKTRPYEQDSRQTEKTPFNQKSSTLQKISGNG
ncbi:MAG: hypothetical protein LUF78_05155 [Clostridiales bacterium]|nr:hypothetical protein [Clostridiales bacterium]